MSETSKKKRAVLYLRVSSRSQVDTDYDPEGNSIPAQRKACLQKAEDLGFEVLDEYLEPGKSGMTVDGRPKFQEMMARVRNSKDVDAIIVYARSRMHRDTTDAAITRRELRKLRVQLVSIMDYTEDSYIGDLVAAILDGVNEYQSRASGADVAYKLAAKASRGGIPCLAPLGYLNVGEKVDGREVRTIAVDPKRAPFVAMMFELYATGRYGFKDLQRAVTEAGLRTRPRKDVPSGRPVTIETIGRLLRDRRYLGRVVFKGKEYDGRHEPLITQELFDRVQSVLVNQRGAGTRERVYDHPLKGLLWCANCRTRFYLDTVKNRRGLMYSYFLCSGRANKHCQSPRLPVAKMEAAIAAHYATLNVPPSLAGELRAAVDKALREKGLLTASLRKKLEAEHRRLVEQQDQLLDLVGNPAWPQDRLEAKMCRLRDELGSVEERLNEVGDVKVERAGEAIGMLLGLLDDPRRLLKALPEDFHKPFHRSYFKRLLVYVDEATGEPKVSADEISSPFTPLLPERRDHLRPETSKTGPLIATRFSDNAGLAGVTGLEPATLGFGDRCATNCATLLHQPVAWLAATILRAAVRPVQAGWR
ncbi:Site-specific DNA recombinase [Glycomyces sambucus]|uniref:Site-specific DNA recombinase n=1 Tax=Glycomyces sambucus TaxID=380244 RepID=A0A1G9MYV1_9ACTN|nr:Site-specific DNA recombinase [Glycomyces sambucus]